MSVEPDGMTMPLDDTDCEVRGDWWCTGECDGCPDADECAAPHGEAGKENV